MATKNDIVEAVAKSLAKIDLSQQAVGVIQRAAEKVLKRTQQDVSAGIKENADVTIDTFSRNLAEKLGKLSQNWCDNTKHELMVYPEGTRYIQKNKNVTAIIVEQPPQVRTIDIKGYFHHLSMPYVVFATAFTDGHWYQRLLVGCRNQPVSSLHDKLEHLPLPNVSEHSVCMGDFKPNKDKNQTQQVGEIISTFWQSRFNDSAFTADPEVYTTWAKMTAEDPLFILKKTRLPGKTVSDLLSCFPEHGKHIDIINTLKTEIVSAVGNIGADVQKTILDIDLIKQNKEKVSIETLDEILKEIIVQSYAELWEFLEAQLQRERTKMQQEMNSFMATNHKW